MKKYTSSISLSKVTFNENMGTCVVILGVTHVLTQVPHLQSFNYIYFSFMWTRVKIHFFSLLLSSYKVKISLYFCLHYDDYFFIYILRLCALNPSILLCCWHAKSFPLCLTLYDPMDGSLPGSSVHGILQARILGWIAVSSSRGSSQPRG